MALIAYHTGKALTGQALKDRLLAEAALHRAQDRLMKGLYYQNGTADWKGCAVGCTLKSLTELKLYKPPEQNNATLGAHVQFERIGIPESLALLQDTIFEGLPAPDHTQWPEQFLAAIKPGADLSMVVTRFMLRILTDKQHGTITHCDERGKAATLTVAKLLRRRLRGDEPTAREWAAARAAAGAAARAAAGAAARAAAGDAARAAAGDAARAAAGAAAGAAAWAAHYQWMRDVLLRLLRTAPMAVQP